MLKTQEGTMASLAAPETGAQFPYFTEEHHLIRQTVKRFAREQIAPFAAEWDKAGIFPRDVFKQAGNLGLFGIRIDPKWGGSGLDWWATAASLEALGYTDCPGVNLGLLAHSELTIPVIAELGTPAQIEEFAKPAIAGDRIGALAISEPGGGSDVAAMTTHARFDGGDLVISGQKLWITNGARADYIVLAVRTGEKGHRGISLVLFPTEVKGFSVGKKLEKIGNHCSDTAELFFDDCRVPARNILGERDRGFYYIMENFQGERLGAALTTLAMMDRSLELARAYASERKAFGRSVGEFQVWKHKFAEHLTNVEAGRWLVYRAVDLVNQGRKAVKEITMAKLYTTELAQRLIYDCMQVFGGFGYVTEYPIARIWRDVRLYTIGAGTSEIMKEIIARQVE
jgi:alkylation response protein AidB-like acyl-CoA dehydrogenase